jgi:hypothetical protein
MDCVTISPLIVSCLKAPPYKVDVTDWTGLDDSFFMGLRQFEVWCGKDGRFDLPAQFESRGCTRRRK